MSKKKLSLVDSFMFRQAKANVDAISGRGEQPTITPIKDQEIVGRTPSKPLTDYRALPCWGLYLHNLDRVILRNVRLVCESGKVSPASCFDNVGSVEIYNVSF